MLRNWGTCDMATKRNQQHAALSDAARSKLTGPLEKLADETERPEKVSVIVELRASPAAPAPKNSKTPKLPNFRSSPLEHLPDPESEEKDMTRLGQQLKKLTKSGSMTRNDLARAFVVDADADQLRTISEWPLVGVIRLNRIHSIPRSSVRAHS